MRDLWPFDCAAFREGPSDAIEKPQLRFRAVVLVVVDGLLREDVWVAAAPPARTWNGKKRLPVKKRLPSQTQAAYFLIVSQRCRSPSYMGTIGRPAAAAHRFSLTHQTLSKV